ncbi:1-deoxy-D-xylulose-5-phosphate synthase [Baekduia alba]|uniref:alpha-ketoacid dehydrogenase subunit beta n=1 Tax=Baekduia alba TaxID=2997333 RepID=UPI00234178D3|nr:transketolase C-terminal domain-containing protein [Baekduia alba]WCB91623.1 1-deoxy-D-xylulose-5-phosphate synthase [Baekduia alba]
MSVTYREALGAALLDALAADERVVLLGQDIGARGGAYGVTAGLLEAFGPARVRDAPSSEAALLGVGVGAALAGMRPVVELTTAAFLPLAYDQLVHHLAAARALSGGALRVPLVLRVPQGAGARLGPVHSANVEGLLHHIPGLRVVAPATVGDARGMLRAAIADDEPVVVLEHTGLYDLVGEDDDGGVAALDRAVVRRAGGDVTLIAASRMAVVAARAAETLAEKHGFAATVVDLRSLRPLDLETVRTAARGANGRAVIVEEGWPNGGVGATLAAALGGRVVRVTGADAFVPYARALEAAALPDEDAVVRAALPLARVRDRRAIGGPDHTMTIEIDMEALVAARRASGGRSLGDLVAAAVHELLGPFGEAAIVTDGGAVTVLGDNRRTSPRLPAATLVFGPVKTSPAAVDGAVTIRHLATLTLTLAAGLATSEDATTLLAALRERLEAG